MIKNVTRVLYSGHVRLFSHLYYIIKTKKYQGSEEPKYIRVFDSLSFTQDKFTNLMYEVQCMSDITILC